MKKNKTLPKYGQVPRKPVGWLQDFALLLQQFSEQFSYRAKITLWFGACLLIGGYYSLILYDALAGKSQATIPIAPIRLPPHLGKTDSVNRQARISTREYRQVLQLQGYIDSLSHLGDTTIYHRFNRQHPGLEDSLEVTKQLYLKQKKGLD